MLAYVTTHFVNHSLGLISVQAMDRARSEEHTSELQSLRHLVCRLLLEKKKKQAFAAGPQPQHDLDKAPEVGAEHQSGARGHGIQGITEQDDRLLGYDITNKVAAMRRSVSPQHATSSASYPGRTSCSYTVSIRRSLSPLPTWLLLLSLSRLM